MSSFCQDKFDPSKPELIHKMTVKNNIGLAPFKYCGCQEEKLSINWFQAPANGFSKRDDWHVG